MSELIVMSKGEFQTFVEDLLNKAASKFNPPPPPPTTKSEGDELITRTETAELLKVRSLVTVDNLSRKGLLKKHYLGTVVRFKKSEVIAFANHSKKGGQR
jgi:hypothetical protein